MFFLMFPWNVPSREAQILADLALSMHSSAESPTATEPSAPAGQQSTAVAVPQAEPRPREIGGPTGPEPTRYGDWERKGRCIDF